MKLMKFGDFKAKESVINEYFCSGRHNKCNVIYFLQNLFSLDGEYIKENCNRFILFEQRRKAISIYQDLFNYAELTYKDFISLCNEVWRESYNYIVIDVSKNKIIINGKLRMIRGMNLL